MELLSPGYGLMFWTLLTIVHLILCVAAVIKLANQPINPETKFAWLLFICLVPLVGTATFFILRKSGRLRSAQ